MRKEFKWIAILFSAIIIFACKSKPEQETKLILSENDTTIQISYDGLTYTYKYEFPYTNISANQIRLSEYQKQFETAKDDFGLRDLHFLIGECYLYLGNLVNANNEFELSYKYNPDHAHSTRIAMYKFLLELSNGNNSSALEYFEESLGQGLAFDVLLEAKKSKYFSKITQNPIFAEKYNQILEMVPRNMNINN